MNDWRTLRARPGGAHLWAMTPGGWWRTKCGRVQVINLVEFTRPAPIGNGLTLKCRCCIPHEHRRK